MTVLVEGRQAVEPDAIEVSDETGRWRSRPVAYWAGAWNSLRNVIPTFSLEELRANDAAPPNPFMRAVVRKPRARFEQPIPIGVVSNSYALVQHVDVVDRCLAALQEDGVPVAELACEVGLTELGEWMNFRMTMPERFSYPLGNDDSLALRLEVFNSVDGGSRLVVLFGWFRFVCGNGLVIGESVSEFRSIHNEGLDLEEVGESVRRGLRSAAEDLRRLAQWRAHPVQSGRLVGWSDGPLSKVWGPKAACRVLNVCISGFDVEVTDASSPAPASLKKVKRVKRVPGAPEIAANLFDVGQALSWVAKSRTVPEERVARLKQIPQLLMELGSA